MKIRDFIDTAEKKKRWAVALGYVGFIYSTLGFTRIPLGFLRRNGLLRLSLKELFVLCLGGVLLLLAKRKGLAWWRVGLALSVFGTYYLTAHQVGTPEEQLHFFEYGLVGLFFVRALKLNTPSMTKALIWGWALGCLAGAIDEFIQKFIPSRVFDLGDILLNVLSVTLGLLVYKAVPHRRKITQ